MYEYVTPEKIFSALDWLKANHPHYASIKINAEWSKNSQELDLDLFDGLMKNTVGDSAGDLSGNNLEKRLNLFVRMVLLVLLSQMKSL